MDNFQLREREREREKERERTLRQFPEIDDYLREKFSWLKINDQPTSVH